MNQLILLILSFYLTFFSFNSLATMYYVSTGGDDQNLGTSPDSPWRTLAHAEANATKAGDIIYLKRGDVWQLSSAFAITNGGTADKYITWDGGTWGTGANAIIRNAEDRTDGNNVIVNILMCDYVKFKSITIDGNNKRGDGLAIGGSYGIGILKQNDEEHISINNVTILNIGNDNSYNNAFLVQPFFNDISDILVDRLTIDGCNDQGVTLYCARSNVGANPSELTNVLIRNCYITNYGRRNSNSIAGIIINNRVTGVIIEYCTIIGGANSYGNAVEISHNEPDQDYYPEGITLRYNLIADSPENGIFIQNGGAITSDIYGNIIYGSGYAGIFIAGGPGDDFSGAAFKIYNNTLYDNASYGFATSYTQIAGSPVVSFKNNLIYVKKSELAIGDFSGLITEHSTNNIYSNAGPNANVLNDGSNYFTAFTLHNWEPSSQNADPNFKDIINLPTVVNDQIGPERDGLNIRTNSPAKDNGTVLDGAYMDSINLIQRPLGEGWDIGAYELLENYQPLSSPKNLRIFAH